MFNLYSRPAQQVGCGSLAVWKTIRLALQLLRSIMYCLICPAAKRQQQDVQQKMHISWFVTDPSECMCLLVSHLDNQQPHGSRSYTHTLPHWSRKWHIKKYLGYSKVVLGRGGGETEVEGKWESNNTGEAEIVLKWVDREEGMSHGKMKMYFHSANYLIHLFENSGSILNPSTFLLEVPCNNKWVTTNP